MQIIHNELPLTDTSQIILDTFTEKSIFFDIETTGFSPSRSVLYLIGCAIRTDTTIEIWQFFSEAKKEQPLILMEFLKLLDHYHTIISFHGLGFDLPYLKAKCAEFHLEEHFDDFTYLDLYKSVSHLKFLLQLPDYKQKTLEDFLGVQRKDRYTGGDLIKLYHQYEKNPTENVKELLLLHNYEDVLGMRTLLFLLSYNKLFLGFYRIADACADDWKTCTNPMLSITLECTYGFPVSLQLFVDGITLSLDRYTAQLSVPLFCGELRFFYGNYHDYYYLPEEDMAIHKSVASFVDKEFRQKAKASNCYTRKSGCFAPQFTSLFTPEFKINYHDKTAFFEFHADFLSSSSKLRAYTEQLLSHLSNFGSSCL